MTGGQQTRCGNGANARKNYCNASINACVSCPDNYLNCNENNSDGCEAYRANGNSCN